ncbi:MAG: tRNA-intron lyase [Candidatus Aenigmarchaeota archaeon]|nr:tRNA-intron lyase [Candidatus Aenigmarchaeota archaeon]
MVEKTFEGQLIENRVIIWDKDSAILYDESGYGKPQPEEDPNRLELELVEAAYLVEKGKLKVFVKENEKKKKLNFQDLIEIGEKQINQFHPQFVVYSDLRDRGYLVKTGFIFGAHFRLYERGVKLKRGPKAPHEHTKAIVHCVPEESAFSLPEMSRAVRLAHNIRATFWWAVVDKENKVTFYEIKRLTP